MSQITLKSEEIIGADFNSIMVDTLCREHHDGLLTRCGLLRNNEMVTQPNFM
jgi:hypothetical protein